MAAFATYTDVEARWRTLSTAERTTAGVLLDDASVIVVSEYPAAATLDPAITKFVVCAMVKRAMQSAELGDGVSAFSQAAGPFSQSLTYANPSGNLYLNKQERRMLGGPKQVAFTVDTTPVPPAVTP